MWVLVLHSHFLFLRRCFAIANPTHQINEEIRDREVRLIGADGSQLGVMSAAQAQRHADEAGLDLVKISPNAVPPVCKLMDYGKFKFEQAKREKEAKKNQHVVEIKEVRMSPGIDIGDFNTKLRNAQKFLADGNRMLAEGKYTVTWAFNHTPNVDSWRATVVTALAAYSADPTDANWEQVVSAFVDGWAIEYNMVNG